MNEKILIVEDEQEIADLIEVYLLNENYSIQKFYTAKDALACISKESFDLAILDIMLPDMDGFTVCKTIRKSHTFPVIMLTARDNEVDKITGLTIGADDYMTKPFRPLELLARVKAQLRRSTKYNRTTSDNSLSASTLICGDIVLDVAARVCTLHKTPLSLTPSEFTIFRVLLENRGIAVSSEHIFHEIWGNEYYDKNNNTITVHIRHLREKLGSSANIIKTVWGVGYKIEK